MQLLSLNQLSSSRFFLFVLSLFFSCLILPRCFSFDEDSPRRHKVVFLERSERQNCICPSATFVLTYGSMTWALTEDGVQRSEKFLALIKALFPSASLDTLTKIEIELSATHEFACAVASIALFFSDGVVSLPHQLESGGIGSREIQSLCSFLGESLSLAIPVRTFKELYLAMPESQNPLFFISERRDFSPLSSQELSQTAGGLLIHRVEGESYRFFGEQVSSLDRQDDRTIITDGQLTTRTDGSPCEEYPVEHLSYENGYIQDYTARSAVSAGQERSRRGYCAQFAGWWRAFRGRRSVLPI